jgi:hypothetical protein
VFPVPVDRFCDPALGPTSAARNQPQKSTHSGTKGKKWNEALAERRGKRLVAVTGADGNTLAANRAAAAEYGCAGLGLHARAKSVRLHTVAAVGLKCALGHRNALLFPIENLAFDSISEYIATCVRNPAPTSLALSDTCKRLTGVILDARFCSPLLQEKDVSHRNRINQQYTLFVQLWLLFCELSPAMVQLNQDGEKFC